MALKLCWINEEDAKVLGAIVRALRDSHKHLGKLGVQHLSLTMGDGSVRTVKLLVSTADDSEAVGQGGGGEGGGVSYRELTHSITVAGTLPTTTEISTALAATYTDPTPDLVPADGDYIVLTVSSVPKFVARVTTAALTASGEFVRSFTVNSVTYYATLHDCGLY